MNRLRLVSGLIVLAFLMAGIAASAQKGEPKLRTVHGAVINREETPIPSAIVYLRNARTQNVLTHIADEAGKYRFSGLDPNVDYEIHAEFGDLTSNKRTISSFDSRKELDFTLKVDKKKSEK